jgi:hypothetical protein
VPFKPVPPKVNVKPPPAPAPRVLPPTNFVPDPAATPPAVAPAPIKREPVPVVPGLTAFILPRTIPNIIYNGAEFVFFLNAWRPLAGGNEALADDLNKFTDEATMLDEIKESLGDAVTFS